MARAPTCSKHHGKEARQAEAGWFGHAGRGKAAAAALEVLVVKLAAECLAIAIPNIPLSLSVVTGT